ncbi:HAD domain-containing protein [uncultured Tateyamaria sp.]|uniref:HAD domain-containing protein n=1 Tax=uncultured Tateyamaria sp. TaxID=455651 RepID=UPI00260CA4EE|nr:HAD domain-containing protein [uncultured Tateyamaria sp.]
MRTDSNRNGQFWRCPREKVVFLDFDGVLHKGTSETFVKLPLFEDFLRQHSCVSVVISSSWRNANQRYLERLFSDDIVDRLAGTTMPEGLLPRRDQEIDCWVRVHRVTDFIALDDDASLFCPTWPKLFLTDGGKGLVPDDISALHNWAQRSSGLGRC